jgi:hypothetical protein
VEPDVTQPLIDTLVSRRLLRIEDRIGARRVELTHDLLADVVRDGRQQRVALEPTRERERERIALAAVVRQTRRQGVMLSGLALAVIALGIGGVFGLRAQRRAAAKRTSPLVRTSSTRATASAISPPPPAASTTLKPIFFQRFETHGPTGGFSS